VSLIFAVSVGAILGAGIGMAWWYWKIRPAQPTPSAQQSRPPQSPSMLAATADPLEGEALTTAAEISNFLTGREATAPPIPKKETLERDLSLYGVYEQETIRIYKDIYMPRVKQIRAEFAKEGRINAQLDAIYETPQSSDFIRLVAESLQKLALQKAAPGSLPPPSITSPPVTPPPAKAKPELPGKPPTLSELFNKDFSNTMKATDEISIHWQDGTGVEHIKRQLYLDFPAKTQFVGFYVPSSDPFFSDTTLKTCMALVGAVQQAIDDLPKRIAVMAGYRNESNTIQDLTFSGRVFLYHDSFLSITQKAALINAYKAKNYDVQFRGPDYLGDLVIAWHHQHDPKPH
jgi:hypothetical protein